jgi:PAS domain S-box-containing protein
LETSSNLDAGSFVLKQEDRFADQAHLKASRPLAHSSFLERTVEQSGFGLLKIDLNTHQVVFANSRFCQMIGYSLDELTAGKITFRELTHPDDIERCTSLLHHLLRGDIESYTLEKRYLQKDGSTLPVRLTVTKLESSGDGVAPIGIISVPAAAGFAHAMPRLSTLPDGAFFWTRDLRSRSGVCSDGFKIALGLPTDGPTPSFDEFLALVHPDDRARIIEEAGRVEKGMFRTAEHRIVRPAGDVRWVSQSAKPLFDSDGEVIGMVGACLDITNERLKPEGS